MIPDGLNGDALIAAIEAFQDGFDDKSRNRKVRQRCVGLLHDRRIGPLEGFLGLAPASVREQVFSGNPLRGIDGDKVHIPGEASMLKPVIEDEEISQPLLLGEQAGGVTVGADHDGATLHAFCDHERFVS